MLAVAQIAAPYTTFGYEAGLCHDMLEDHILTQDELRTDLFGAGYSIPEMGQIMAMVID